MIQSDAGNFSLSSGEGLLTPDDVTKIAIEVRRLQAEHAQSLTQIAENAEVAPSTVASLANPEGSRGSNPRASTLKKIKDAYPTFMEDREYIELAITGHCYYGKVNPPRAMEPSSMMLKRSGVMDFEQMAAVVMKKEAAQHAQSAFSNAYFFHPKNPADSVMPDEAIGKFCVIYERRDDEVAAGGVWLGVLERRPDSPQDLVLVSLASAAHNPTIIAPKAAQSLNIEYIMLVHGIMLQAQIDAILGKDKQLSPDGGGGWV